MGELAPHHPQDSGFLTYPLLPLCNPLRRSPIQEVSELFL